MKHYRIGIEGNIGSPYPNKDKVVLCDNTTWIGDDVIGVQVAKYDCNGYTFKLTGHGIMFIPFPFKFKVSCPKYNGTFCLYTREYSQLDLTAATPKRSTRGWGDEISAHVISKVECPGYYTLAASSQSDANIPLEVTVYPATLSEIEYSDKIKTTGLETPQTIPVTDRKAYINLMLGQRMFSVILGNSTTLLGMECSLIPYIFNVKSIYTNTGETLLRNHFVTDVDDLLKYLTPEIKGNRYNLMLQPFGLSFSTLQNLSAKTYGTDLFKIQFPSEEDKQKLKDLYNTL